jgi:DNA invertase Pin-like site-specific DNA recombinase
MAQEERELISGRARAALAAAKLRLTDRLAPEVEPLQIDDATGQAAIARALTERMVPTPLGIGVGTRAA